MTLSSEIELYVPYIQCHIYSDQIKNQNKDLFCNTEPSGKDKKVQN